jgi:hypothetical protein
MYDNLKYLTCTKCLDEKTDISRLSVAVTPLGDLVIECLNHGCLVEFLPNDTIADALQLIAGSKCEGANHDHSQDPKEH